MREMTVGDALRWLKKLEQCQSEGVKVILVQHLMKGIATRCAEIADRTWDRYNSESALSAIDSIRNEIRAEFQLDLVLDLRSM